MKDGEQYQLNRNPCTVLIYIQHALEAESIMSGMDWAWSACRPQVQAGRLAGESYKKN